MTHFPREDFIHTAHLLRGDNEPARKATLSNNLNIIIDALDEAATADEARTKAALYAKTLFKLRSTLMNVQSAIEDEGDRKYFGSINDADELQEVAREIEDLEWEEVLRDTQPPVDLYALLAEQRAAVGDAVTIIRDFLACPEIADCAPEDLDQETRSLETRARRYLEVATKE